MSALQTDFAVSIASYSRNYQRIRKRTANAAPVPLVRAVLECLADARDWADTAAAPGYTQGGRKNKMSLTIDLSPKETAKLNALVTARN